MFVKILSNSSHILTLLQKCSNLDLSQGCPRKDSMFYSIYCIIYARDIIDSCLHSRSPSVRIESFTNCVSSHHPLCPALKSFLGVSVALKLTGKLHNVILQDLRSLSPSISPYHVLHLPAYFLLQSHSGHFGERSPHQGKFICIRLLAENSLPCLLI